MRETPNWQDLKLFIEVANAKGLVGATVTTGVSAPTLGRRMLTLEHAVGRELFVRHRSGYDLTAAGRDLLLHALEMQTAYAGVERWQESANIKPIVKISAGIWTSHFIARNCKHLLSGAQGIRIALAPDNNFVDINKREAHLAIRNLRPSQSGLAMKKLAAVEFAVYGSKDLITNSAANPELADLFVNFPWVTFEPSGDSTASTTWLKGKLTKSPLLSCSAPTPVLEAARAGAGLCILPCFIGDTEPTLCRYSQPIDDLAHTQWLVSHDDDRHLKHVKTTAKRLQQIFKNFLGENLKNQSQTACF